MLKTNLFIQVLVTSKKCVNETAKYGLDINGLYEMNNVSDRLLFDGSDTIYVHITEPVTQQEIDAALSRFCNTIKQKGLVSNATYCRMAVPKFGGDGVVFSHDYKIKEDRYCVLIIV